jgi:cell division transport system permease protein
VLRALGYFIVEACASIWRGRRAAALAIMTIAAGLFLLGFFLVVNSNLSRLVSRWTEAAEMSVYLADDIQPDQRAAIEAQLGDSPLVLQREYVSKEDARARFRTDFSDLASLIEGFQENPLPASFEVRLRSAPGQERALDEFAARLAGTAGVADVRYDRLWLSRLNMAIVLARAVSVIIVTIVSIAAALTVANVVRLAAYARRDEIEIMQLVGAPIAYVRGPFILEGVLQGGGGALMALALLWVGYVIANARYGRLVSGALGLDGLAFLPLAAVGFLLFGGMIVGCVGGIVAARGVR